MKPNHWRSHSFIPRPNSGEEVEVRLPDEMGQDFLTRFHSRDVQVNSDYFEDYFKGLVVIPEEPTTSRSSPSRWPTALPCSFSITI